MISSPVIACLFSHSFDRAPIRNVISASTQSLNSSYSSPQPSCHSINTPACVQDLYGVPKTLATQPSNSLFVSGFGGEYANQQDLSEFLATYRPDLPSNTTFSLVSVNGGINNQKLSIAGVEANLDIQYTIGLASGVPTSYVSVGPEILPNTTEFYHALQDEANYILKMDNPPTVLTSSYSNVESLMSRALARYAEYFPVFILELTYEHSHCLERYAIYTCSSVRGEYRFFSPAEIRVSVVVVCYSRRGIN